VTPARRAISDLAGGLARPPNLFLGLAVIGPVALKLASTGYRFCALLHPRPGLPAQGSTDPGAARAGAAGHIPDRSAARYGGGTVVRRPRCGPLGEAHKICFIAWITFTAIHVLGHLPEILRVLSSSTDSRRQIIALRTAQPAGMRSSAGIADRTEGARGRAGALLISLLAGLVLATALIGQFSVWTH
jgi:hypothetical protein